MAFGCHAIDEGQCTLEVPFQAAFERPGGIVSGQVFMAAADVAMWLAIMTRLGAHDDSVTAGMTSAFLGAARRESFRCTARIVKLGGGSSTASPRVSAPAGGCWRTTR